MRRSTKKKTTTRISSRDINRAVRAFDFEDFLIGEGVDVSAGDTGEIRGTCPFCQSSSRAPFCVNATTGAWLCHACPKRGGPVQLVVEVLGTDYPGALKRLVENFKVFVDEDEYDWEDDDEDFEEAEDDINRIDLPKEFRLLANKLDSISAKPYLRYAKSRKLDIDIIKKYRIGFATTGRYTGRLIVPVYHLGSVATFVARDTTNTAECKVDTPYGNDQGKICFNLDNIWGRKEVVITEGVFDALMLPEMAVATFGKKISVEQVRLLQQSGAKTLVFCYDEDALSEAYKFADKWSRAFNVKLVELPPNRDPNKLGRETMLELLDDAIWVDPTLVVL